MAKRRGKGISFDAMVKFFMQHYDLPTKKDIEKLMGRMDQLEKLIKASGKSGRRTRGSGIRVAARRTTRSRNGVTALDRVLEVIRSYKQGAGFAEIQANTGFDEKKIRNIIFRLNKIGKIKRKSRGLYVVK
ncbi:MAG: hypothetical protein PVI06_08020 [Desulfobacterales bacterium]|jgi:hypothetical protein